MHMADQLQRRRRDKLEQLTKLLEQRDVPCDPEDLESLVNDGYVNERLLGAASKANLVAVGLTPALASLLVQEFGGGVRLRYLRGGGPQGSGQQGRGVQGGGLKGQGRQGGGRQGGGLQGGGLQGGGLQGPAANPQSQLDLRATVDTCQRVANALAAPNIVPKEDFQDKEIIGHGESGPVCAAWLHGRRVAVKFGDCNNRKQVLDHMFNEVATHEALRHLQGTFIPRLEEHGYEMWGESFEESDYFIATQLINGRTHEEGSEVTVAQRLAAEQALAAIHDAGYLHGDVRGDNLIFENGSGKAFFLDLGYSRKGSCAVDFGAEMHELHGVLAPDPSTTSVHIRPHA